MNVIDTPAALKRLREDKGWTLEAAHQQLRLHIKQIEALEAGQWDKLPGMAFVRASLRSYGKALQADVGPLLESLSDHKEPELRSATSLDRPMTGQSMLGFGNGGSGYRWAWVLLGVLGLAALALYFAPGQGIGERSSWLQQRKDTTVVTPPVAGQAGAKPEVSPPSQGSEPAASGTSTSAVPLNLPAQSSQDTSSSPPPAPGVPLPASDAPSLAPVAPTQAASGSAAAGASVLTLNFNIDSWVEIKQADGKVLLYGIQKANTTANLDAAGEVQLTIGNAAKVELQYQGKPVALSPAPGSGIARITLKP
jgi:cytoskeleton protein RodZ